MKKVLDKPYDINQLWLKICDVCENEINDEIDVNFKSGLNQVLIDILVEFYEYKQEDNVLLTKDVLKNRKDLPSDDIDEETGYYEATIDDVKNDLNNFVHYYLLDDGKISLYDDKLIPPSKLDVKDSYYDDNITQTGASLWILQQLGNQVYCDIVMFDENYREGYKLATSDNFVNAMKEFDKIIKEKDIDKKHCRLDYCLSGSDNKFVIRILPEIE